ncbi:hypothetical protein PP633_13755 [Mycobacteroides abscessus]|uniref:hypothetical protein n=1 Tax=Mycobacteroides abscessus TaxID=36809 RepID=UPI0009CBB619|nr:hypothetical protein [Mycobacteroides abscessus]MDM2644732.1 hypothetical protein [Mycobacteroides abscessus]MDM2654170.1 hypothetical protein [Mycobacteroides abscessus]MDM2663283.1 hypothetical protein [Mycobacteroides abscessus]MDM2669304.1 hypothetical protein [Mycobacteroides abscessus]MDM2674192.1 hypothetical protein [Mycobacteroides abscessus]
MSSEDVLSLGARLAAELRDRDILGNWMAQYLAELLLKIEDCPPEHEATLKAQVAEVILQLWAHRGHLPVHRYPFRSFDEVFAALTRLEEAYKPWGRLGIFDGTKAPSEHETANIGVLAGACSVDEGAYRVVRLAVALAAASASAQEAEWIRLGQDVANEEYQRSLRHLRRFARIRAASDATEDEDWDGEEDPTTDGGVDDDEISVLRDKLVSAVDALVQGLQGLKASAVAVTPHA